MRDPRRIRSSNDTTPETPPTREIPLAQIKEVERFRIRHPPYENIDLLAASIEAVGLMTPLGVQPLKDGNFGLVFGYRRTAALRLLGFEKAPCHILDLDDDEAYDAAVIENQQRGDLNDFERAEICQAYHKAGRTLDQIAKTMGWSSEKSVRRYLRIADHATAPLKDALRSRGISLRAAAVFLKLAAGLPEDKQREILATRSFTEASSEELDRQLRKLIDPPKKGGAAKNREPIKVLKNGSFVLRSIRFDAADPTALREAVAVLRTALKKARTIERSIAGASNGETKIVEQEVAG